MALRKSSGWSGKFTAPPLLSAADAGAPCPPQPCCLLLPGFR
jgi:hypothetical protein